MSETTREAAAEAAQVMREQTESFDALIRELELKLAHSDSVSPSEVRRLKLVAQAYSEIWKSRMIRLIRIGHAARERARKERHKERLASPDG